MENSRTAFSIREAARSAGLSERNVHQLALIGAIASVKVGRRRLITPQALDAFLAKHTQPAIDPAEIARKILANEKPDRKTTT